MSDSQLSRAEIAALSPEDVLDALDSGRLAEAMSGRDPGAVEHMSHCPRPPLETVADDPETRVQGSGTLLRCPHPTCEASGRSRAYGRSRY